MFFKQKLKCGSFKIESRTFLKLAALIILVNKSFQHGYLEEPPARNCAWRFGFNTPKNFDDNGLNCGGFANQWEHNSILISSSKFLF